MERGANRTVRDAFFDKWRDAFFESLRNDAKLLKDLEDQAGIVFNPNPPLGQSRLGVFFKTKVRPGEPPGPLEYVGLDIDHAAIGHSEAVQRAIDTQDASLLLKTVDGDGLQFLLRRENRAQIERLRKDAPRWQGAQTPLSAGARWLAVAGLVRPPTSKSQEPSN
jgi:hypothetical protein